MLKKFFLNTLSSFVGAWAAITLFIVASVIVVLSLLGSYTQNGMRLTDHSVLKLSLTGEIQEYDGTYEIDYMSLLSGSIEKPKSLHNLQHAIRSAATNSKIDAIYIECAAMSAAPATLNALRASLKDFKKSGKKIIAYGDYLTMGDYFVASIADELYLNPDGSLDIQGINGTVLYYKDLLDKIGVEFEAVKVGTFKSAVEPYISNEMSQPARLQLDTLYSTMWNYIKKDISEVRKIRSTTIDSLVNHFIFLEDASVAAKYKFIDGCKYQREIKGILGSYLGVDSDNINFVTPEFMAQEVSFESSHKDGSIAVLYAVGEIGEYPGAGINCKQFVPQIVSLAEDDNVKGMVLRVNSPGGSVFGSEQIGEALDYFKSKGKTLAVSMGDYATSGGYWISAGANRIFADPLTITGSIGIFGLVPNVQKLTEKIGVHPQSVSTNPGVHFPSIFYPMSPAQHDALQKSIERGYDKFIDRVATGRDISPEKIRAIAEGRVWNAMTALKLGLVDELGGLQEAISWVAEKAGMKKYGVAVYPQVDNGVMGMLPELMEQNATLQALKERMAKQDIDRYLIEKMMRLLVQRNEQARSIEVRVRL